MKKLLIILMIISISLSVFSCKRSPVNDTGEIIPEANKENTENTDKAEENSAPSTETEGVKQDKTDNSSAEELLYEEKETSHELSIVDDKNQLGAKTLDIVEKGYAYYKDIPGYTLLMADKDFEFRFEITKEIKDEIMQTRVADDQYIIPATDDTCLMPDWTFDEYIENVEKNETVVKGHFEQTLGTHVIRYKLHENSEIIGLRNFSIDEEYTLIPFVIDKVYGETELKAGDTINLRYYFDLNMNFDTKAYEADQNYTFFDECTLEERSYITSLKLTDDGSYQPYSIFQKCDPDNSGRDCKTLKEFADDVCNYYS